MHEKSEGYEKPEVRDFGTIADLTAASGQVGSEDGIGKTIQAGVPGGGAVSVGVFP